MVSATQLSPLETTFLPSQDRSAHPHVAAVLVFEGPAPSYDEFLAHIEPRLHRVPRLRQRLALPAGAFLRPRWVDDPLFAVRLHIRHAGLPHPRSEDELQRLAGRVLGLPLDSARPLWEMLLVDELAGGRFAIIAKLHPALVEGVPGMDLLSTLLDPTPDPAPTEVASWRPAPGPSRARLLVDAWRDQVADAVAVSGAAARLAVDPAEAARTLGRCGRGAARAGVKRLFGTAPTPYGVRLSPHRRCTWVRGSLDEVEGIRERLGGSVEDVVLATLTGAVRRHLARREVDVESLEMVAMAPARGRIWPSRTALYVPLPVWSADPVERLLEVSRQTAEQKAAEGEGQRHGGGRETPGLLALGARMLEDPRPFDLTVTTVRDPACPLFLLGRRMTDLFPMVPLAPQHALGVAVLSYDGRLEVGLLGDHDALADLGDLADDVYASLEALRMAAGAPRGQGRALRRGERLRVVTSAS